MNEFTQAKSYLEQAAMKLNSLTIVGGSAFAFVGACEDLGKAMELVSKAETEHIQVLKQLEEKPNEPA